MVLSICRLIDDGLLAKHGCICLFNKKEGMVGAEIIFNQFTDLTKTQKDQIAQLFEVYQEWNNQINVISRKDFENFYERHVLHSLGIAKLWKVEDGQTVIDIGTGGGFPGVPLAILYPEVQFTLCDSIGKKMKVVNEVCTALNLTNVTAIHARSEDIKGTYDIMISRAVSRFPAFIRMTKHLLKKQNAGIYYLKGGDLNEEISELKDEFPKKKISLYKLSDHFKEPFFDTKYVVKVF